MSTEYEKTALLALPAIAEGSSEEKGLLSWSRPYMIDQIRQHGVDVAVTRGVKSFDEAGNIANDVIRPHYSEEGTEVTRIDRLGSIGLDNFGMIRNIVRPLMAETTTPQLNPNSIRYLARNKFAVMQDLLVPVGVYNRQAVTIDGETSLSDISASIDALPGDFIVAKPNGGQRSRGVIVGTKAEVEKALRDTGVTEPYILEEKLHFANALPGIRGRSADEHAELERANQAGVNREVRTYFFGQNDWDTVGRVAKVGEADFRSDEWLQLDLESVLGTLVESANDVEPWSEAG